MELDIELTKSVDLEISRFFIGTLNKNGAALLMKYKPCFINIIIEMPNAISA